MTLDVIAINGDGEKGLDHETLFFDDKETGFNFCKTARKPYDYAVRKYSSTLKRTDSLLM